VFQTYMIKNGLTLDHLKQPSDQQLPERLQLLWEIFANDVTYPSFFASGPQAKKDRRLAMSMSSSVYGDNEEPEDSGGESASCTPFILWLLILSHSERASSVWRGSDGPQARGLCADEAAND